MLQEVYQKLRKAESLLGVEAAALAHDAARFAEDAHRGQIRSGGQPYVTHVWRVMLAAIDEFVREPLLSPEFVIAGPLHDVVEDCGVSLETIEERFGPEVARIVRHVTHHYEDEPEEEYLALVAAGGPKAVRLKRLDKLDNLRDLAHATPEFRAQKLAELPIFFALWREIDPEGASIIEKAAEGFKGDAMAEESFDCSVCGFWFCQCPEAEAGAEAAMEKIFDVIYGKKEKMEEL